MQDFVRHSTRRWGAADSIAPRIPPGQAMGNGQWAMGNGQWVMGNGQWAMCKVQGAMGNRHRYRHR